MYSICSSRSAAQRGEGERVVSKHRDAEQEKDQRT
jgi:hypothetical protein